MPNRPRLPRLQPMALALLACTALLAVQAYDLYREWSRSIEATRANTANLARLLDAHAQQVMEQADTLLAEAVDLVQRYPGEPPMPELRRLVNERSAVRALAVIDAAGRLWPSEPAMWGEDPAATARWRLALQSLPAGQRHVGRPVRSADGSWRMPLARTTWDAQGRPLGFVVVLVRHRHWQRVFDAVDVGRSGFVTLFQEEGWIVATAPRNDALLERRWIDTPLFQEHLPRSTVQTVRQVVVRDGTERVYSYRRLADWPLVISVGISMHDVLADWRQRVAWQAVLLAVLAASLLAGAWVLQRAQRQVAAARDRAEGSERLLQQVSDNLPVRISFLDRELRYRFVNEAHRQRFGLPQEQILGRTRVELTGQPLQPALQAAVADALAGEPQRVEFEEALAGCPPRFIETHLVPARGPGGSVVGLYTASNDVTEQRLQRQRIEQALRERETLLREVYHRVKNNLQVVRSLLSLQRRSVTDEAARTVLDDAARRIQAMALVHEMLYKNGTLQAVSLQDYTRELLQHLGESAGAAARGIVLDADIAAVNVSLEAAVPYGLLVNELVGNSLKHAFPGGRGGRVQVRLERAARGCTFTVADDGVGLPPGLRVLDAQGTGQQPAQGMGLQLAQSLAGQLGGVLRRGDGPGAVFSARLQSLE